VSTTECVEADVWVTRVSLGEYDVRSTLVLGERRANVWDTLSRPHDMQPFVRMIGGRGFRR
jgi:hypothetical protein